MRPPGREELIKYNLTRMNQNPYEDHRLRVVRKTQGTLQDNKNDNHLELWGSYSRIRTKSHKNEN